MSDPPFRKDSSLELTAVRPRPPLSDIPGPTIEQLADIERARRDAEDAIATLVPCPGPCRTCPCCHGAIMVSDERAKAWRAEHPEEPIPPSRPEAA
jgi:hypothetical protein